jgi:AAA domain
MKFHIVSISGKMGSGKTTITSELERSLKGLGYVTKTVKFADPIYQIHDYAQDLLMAVGFYSERPGKDRNLLQLLGTQWGRAIDKDIWAKIAVRKCQAIRQNMEEVGTEKCVVFIDDTRFPNEFDYIDSALRVRLVCSEEVRKHRATSWSDTPHESELALDDYADRGLFDMYFNTEIETPEEISTSILNRLGIS